MISFNYNDFYCNFNDLTNNAKFEKSDTFKIKERHILHEKPRTLKLTFSSITILDMLN